MKPTDWIVAIAAILQAVSTVAIVWLTRRYVALQGDLVKLQKALTNLQETIVHWQTRIQVEARPFFRITEKQEFGKPGIVGFRVANLSAIGVWLDLVEIMISEVGPKHHNEAIQIDDVLPPDTSREFEIWTSIDDYGKQDKFELVRTLNVRILITYVANSQRVILAKECRFEYSERRARNFVLTVP